MDLFLKKNRLLTIIALGTASLFYIIAIIGYGVNQYDIGGFWLKAIIFLTLFAGIILGFFFPIIEKLSIACSVGFFAYLFITFVVNEPLSFSSLSGTSSGLLKAVFVFDGLAGLLSIFGFFAIVLYFALHLAKKVMGMVSFFIILGAIATYSLAAILMLFYKYQDTSFWFRGFEMLARSFALLGGLFAFEWAKSEIASNK